MSKNTETITVTVKSVVSAIAESVTAGITPVVAIQNSDYGIMDRAEKARVRSAFKARFDGSMSRGEFDSAKVNWEIHEAFRNANSGNGKPSVSNSDELRTVIVGMATVLNAFVNGESAPTGIDPVDLSDEFDFEFGFALEWDGEMPEMTDELVTRFVPKRISRNGPANDISALVADAFSDIPVGEFRRVSEIRNEIAKRNSELNVDSSWDGRIMARLFPNSGECTIPGITPLRNHDIGNSQTRNGAMRNAD